MGHPILFGLLGAFIVSRIVFRVRMRRWRHAHGGGCGRFGGGPIDLGAPDGERRFGRFERRFERRWRRWRDAEARVPVAAEPAVDLPGALELNQRQRELFDEVLAKARLRMAAPELAEALAILAREPFDRSALEFLVGKSELADDLEHLHFSLTPEQRAKLGTVASA